MKWKSVRVLAVIACGGIMGAVFGCGDENSTVGPQETYVQVDRMGIPTINTALIPSSMKEGFNRSNPANDVSDYAATVEATITALRSAVEPVLGPEDSPGLDAATLTGVLIPDVVTINFQNPLVFPNGRRLEDDVIDAALGLVLNRGNPLGGGGGVSDGVPANDVAFMPTFPYLAPPQSLPKGSRP